MAAVSATACASATRSKRQMSPQTQPAAENNKVRVLWNLQIGQPDKQIQARRPDLVTDKQINGGLIIVDATVPNVEEKEKEKI